MVKIMIAVSKTMNVMVWLMTEIRTMRAINMILLTLRRSMIRFVKSIFLFVFVMYLKWYTRWGHTRWKLWDPLDDCFASRSRRRWFLICRANIRSSWCLSPSGRWWYYGGRRSFRLHPGCVERLIAVQVLWVSSCDCLCAGNWYSCLVFALCAIPSV